MKQKVQKLKKKIKKVADGRGCIYIHSSFNNTIITVTRENNEKLAQISARTATGYRGTKKSTPFAAQKAAEKTLAIINDFGISLIKIIVQGIGSGRDAVLKVFCSKTDLQIEKLIDKNAFPFNGCRPRKAPRK